MKKQILFLVLILVTSSLWAQDRSIDLKAVKKEANGDKYDYLMSRYLENDTSLSLNDYRLLYYGHAFREDYRPNSRHDSISALSELFRQKEDDIDFEKGLRLCKLILEEYPFNINQVLYAGICCEQLGKRDDALCWIYKYKMLLKTILSSGDGLKAETAFVVTKISDEYTVLNALDLEFKKQSLITDKSGYFDLMEVGKNDMKIKELYFDIQLFFGKGF